MLQNTRMNQIDFLFFILIFCLGVVCTLQSMSEVKVPKENILRDENRHAALFFTPALKIIPENCSIAVDAFNEKMTELIQCTLNNARPVRVCVNCEKEIKDTEKTYKKLKNESSDCQKFYFESDQIGIINLVYSQGQVIWSKNYCQNCYDHSNDTARFFNVSKQFDACVHKANETSDPSSNSTCEMCHELFAELNDLYNKFVLGIGAYYVGGVCMDIVDRMNVTRRYWATQNCVTFDFNIGYPNVITAVLVGAMPVFFYLLSKNISIIEDVKLVRPKRKTFNTVPVEN